MAPEKVKTIYALVKPASFECSYECAHIVRIVEPNWFTYDQLIKQKR